MTFCRPGECAGSTGLWKHGPIAVIGLIGGIGSGKSAVAAILVERGGVVIDADGVGHELLTQPDIKDQIVDRIGESVLDRVNLAPCRRRKSIGRHWVRSCSPIRKRWALEAILHPRMRDRFRREIERLTGEGQARVIVLDAAILLEAGWDDLCDCVVFVDAPLSARASAWRSSEAGPIPRSNRVKRPNGHAPRSVAARTLFWSTTQESTV